MGFTKDKLCPQPPGSSFAPGMYSKVFPTFLLIRVCQFDNGWSFEFLFELSMSTVSKELVLNVSMNALLMLENWLVMFYFFSC